MTLGCASTDPHTAERLACILNSIPHIIWSCGPDGAPDFVSEQWTRHYGGDRSELFGNGWISFIHPEDRDSAVEKWNSALDAGESYQAKLRLRLPAGDYRWALVTARPETESDGNPTRWFGTCTDIHEPVLISEELAGKERLYRSVLDASADCIKVLSTDGHLELMNDPGLRLMEIADFGPITGTLWWDHWPASAEATVRKAVDRARDGETFRFNGLCPTAAGTPKWWDVVVTPIRNQNGQVVRILAISRDCTAEREKTEQLAWASEHDALTALPNRRAFQARLRAAALRAMASGRKVGLLLIDLDHFKHVNDTLGHPAGDELLLNCADRLSSGVRPTDFVGRIGGDEFAIIVEGVESSAALLHFGQRIASALKEPAKIQGRSISGGASIGGAIFPDDAGSANELFKVADTALYALKADGRGGTKLFHSYMRQEAQRVASQLNVARNVVREKLIRPSYQLKVDLRSGFPIGAEALLRWCHRGNRLHLPETIEEAFKDYELASSIGAVMQEQVFSDLSCWSRDGVDVGRISINAAPVEFLRNDYAERLLDRLSRQGVSPSLIEVEVTEHVLMANGAKYVLRALLMLKEAGITVALDDFGTGYSSLSHLRDFPVDVVKIDKSFVQQVTTDPEMAAIVTAVISLAKSLEIRTVAEGLETQCQVDLLRAAGCDYGQGYVLGRPLGAEEIVQHFSARLHTESAAA